MEVCNRNTWSIVCADTFGINEARVICRQLGFNSTYVNYAQLQHVQIINSIEIQEELVPVDLVPVDLVPVDLVPIFDEFVECLGNEASLAECRILSVDRRKRGLSSGIQPTCQYQAGVQCGGIYYIMLLTVSTIYRGEDNRDRSMKIIVVRFFLARPEVFFHPPSPTNSYSVKQQRGINLTCSWNQNIYPPVIRFANTTVISIAPGGCINN